MSHRESFPEDPKFLGRLSAIAEIALVLISGALLSRFAAQAFDLPMRAARDAVLFSNTGPDWQRAAEIEVIQLVLRYGITFAIILAVVLWIGGPSRRLAGLSYGNRPFHQLVGFGLVMGLLLSAFAQLGHLAKRFFDIGENTPLWTLMQQSEWTPEFWLFMAASSFIAIPIVEELFFRSYAFGRLRMHFSVGGALLISALLFWISHGQYLKLDPLLLYNSTLAFIAALFMAWSVLRTGTLIPAIIAHSIGNVPLTQPLTFCLLFVSILLIFLLRQTLANAIQDLVATVAGTKEWLFLFCLIPVIFGSGILVQSQPQFLPLIVVGFISIAGIGLIRRSPNKRKK